MEGDTDHPNGYTIRISLVNYIKLANEVLCCLRYVVNLGDFSGGLLLNKLDGKFNCYFLDLRRHHCYMVISY